MKPRRRPGRHAPTPPAWLRAAQRPWSDAEQLVVRRQYAIARDLQVLAASVGVSLQVLKRRASALGLRRSLPDRPMRPADALDALPLQRWCRAPDGDARMREVLSRRPPLDRAWS